MVGGGEGISAVKVIVVDEDCTAASQQFVNALKDEASLDVRLAPAKLPGQPFTREIAGNLVKSGDISVDRADAGAAVGSGLGHDETVSGRDAAPQPGRSASAADE